MATYTIKDFNGSIRFFLTNNNKRIEVIDVNNGPAIVNFPKKGNVLTISTVSNQSKKTITFSEVKLPKSKKVKNTIDVINSNDSLTLEFKEFSNSQVVLIIGVNDDRIQFQTNNTITHPSIYSPTGNKQLIVYR